MKYDAVENDMTVFILACWQKKFVLPIDIVITIYISIVLSIVVCYVAEHLPPTPFQDSSPENVCVGIRRISVRSS